MKDRIEVQDLESSERPKDGRGRPIDPPTSNSEPLPPPVVAPPRPPYGGPEGDDGSGTY
jgi:hypothetical protein